MRVVIQNQVVFIRYLVAGTVSVPHHSFYQQSLTKFSTLISSKTITRVKRFQRDRVFNIENSISELMPTAVHDRVTRQLRQGKFISYQKSAPVQTCFKSKVHGREIETAVSITYEVLSSQKTPIKQDNENCRVCLEQPASKDCFRIQAVGIFFNLIKLRSKIKLRSEAVSM